MPECKGCESYEIGTNPKIIQSQREIGIKKGDELLLIRKGGKIMLEKPRRIARKLEDEFRDVENLVESSLRKIWLNKEDEIWNQYLKGGKK